ncbi:MAG: hypothetical protein V1847_03990 [Candidatus Diapherotrites archaeon]
MLDFFKVLETAMFLKIISGLDLREGEWVEKMKTQLSENPFAGKPLRFDWFREKKFEDKRLYYLVSRTNKTVILFSFGNKKGQRKFLHEAFSNKDELLRLLNGINERA